MQPRSKNPHTKLQDIAGSLIKIQGAKLWNKLDNRLKKIATVKQFKVKYKYSVCLPYVKEKIAWVKKKNK